MMPDGRVLDHVETKVFCFRHSFSSIRTLFFSLEYIPHLKISLCLETWKTNQKEAELLLLGNIELA